MTSTGPEDLQIFSSGDKVHKLSYGEGRATITQSIRRLTENREELELTFRLPDPQRFTVSVMVPPECSNACVTLNGQLLISWFGEDIPDDLPEVTLSSCQKQGNLTSTLRPGEFQRINFRWQDGDVLRFYWIKT